nr:immunoglobulin light chain junction region [Macaca mulatta]MOY12253.1 immunoglobulin light chain junction region [Macaca mulatta]MOY14231.1 immunoglobulin light chain junction region [Macaca mulatta]
CQQHNSHPFTF